jgi:hypothetical protein
MIGMQYGSIPIAHDTGGLHDTIQQLNIEKDTGNGFLFEVYDANGLFWAIDQAMEFYNIPSQVKKKRIERIMQQSAEMFNHAVTARQYIELYERMLRRPLIEPVHQKSLSAYRDKIPKTVSATFENLTRRQYDFIRGNIQRIGLAYDRIKDPKRRKSLNVGSKRKKS